MNKDRSEPRLEVITGNQNDTGSFRGYVFFPWPSASESDTEICCDSDRKYVFASSSETSGVTIVFEQCDGIQGGETMFKSKSNMAESTEYIDEEETPMEPCMWLPEPEMQEAVLSRGMEISSSILNHKLSEQEHGPNTDLNLLTAAYVSMDSSVSPSHGDFIVPDPAIYKQRTPLENTVLHLAAAYGKNAMVDNIAQQAPYLFTVTNSNYDTALHAAARAGHASTIQNFLNTWLPFIRRETDGHPKDQFTLQMMLLVSLTLLRNKQGNTFFHEAFMVNAQNGDKIFRAFQDSFITDGLEMEAEFKKIVNHLAVFAVNKEGKSLLYVATEVGCKQVVDQLLDICIEHDVKPQGKSPFLPALTERDMDMLQTILIKKPNWIHLRNEEGRLALHQAASIGYHEAVSY
ncbi:uncharacterized protein LOC114753810 [Neltuma alba]|uniref:uncharacterized protein LOC114753810 n=1 Tax=Neltuma alba TaxID=207710 RepID=UPI0010A4EA8A|nr:uncharacterized protein LOC114753810 [Prosopis alba]